MNTNTFTKLLHAKRMIAKNINNGFSLDAISKEVGMSKFYLARNFKEFFGETMYQFHTRLRISKATKWISRKEFEISDVAWGLGFSDLSAFSKFFKKDLNISPRKFKKYYKKDNGLFLNELYKNARESVFATSNLKFFRNWKSDLGSTLIKSHYESAAKVTRIFVYNSRNDIDNDQLGEFDRQNNSGIQVKLLILNENASLKSKLGEFSDFAIIDEKIAGITKSFGLDNGYTSHWYFKTPEIINNLKNARALIEKCSVDYHDFLLRMNSNPAYIFRYASIL